MTPLQQQVIDAARRWASLRPPQATGALRSTVQAAEKVLERSVLAMEAEAKRAAEGSR